MKRILIFTLLIILLASVVVSAEWVDVEKMWKNTVYSCSGTVQQDCVNNAWQPSDGPVRELSQHCAIQIATGVPNEYHCWEYMIRCPLGTSYQEGQTVSAADYPQIVPGTTPTGRSPATGKYQGCWNGAIPLTAVGNVPSPPANRVTNPPANTNINNPPALPPVPPANTLTGGSCVYVPQAVKTCGARGCLATGKGAACVDDIAASGNCNTGLPVSIAELLSWVDRDGRVSYSFGQGTAGTIAALFNMPLGTHTVTFDDHSLVYEVTITATSLTIKKAGAP